MRDHVTEDSGKFGRSLRLLLLLSAIRIALSGLLALCVTTHPRVVSAAYPLTRLPPCTGSSVEMLEDRRLEKVLLHLLRTAREEIWVGMFFFKAGDPPRGAPGRILRELIRARKRGVQVHVILERPEDPGSNLASDNRSTYHRLLRAGIRVTLDRPDRRSHMKVVVVDRRFTLVGSHNFTQSALRYNHELSVLVDSPCLARRVLLYLQRIIRESPPP